MRMERGETSFADLMQLLEHELFDPDYRAPVGFIRKCGELKQRIRDQIQNSSSAEGDFVIITHSDGMRKGKSGMVAIGRLAERHTYNLDDRPKPKPELTDKHPHGFVVRDLRICPGIVSHNQLEEFADITGPDWKYHPKDLQEKVSELIHTD